jgi:hypothetical protein
MRQNEATIYKKALLVSAAPLYFLSYLHNILQLEKRGRRIYFPDPNKRINVPESFKYSERTRTETLDRQKLRMDVNEMNRYYILVKLHYSEPWCKDLQLWLSAKEISDFGQCRGKREFLSPILIYYLILMFFQMSDYLHMC